ncbi:MAG: hypothetical protein M0Z84_09650, partial [Gammaproteobacteria bacterium]|nr:hypothetical protein [Gammaproteobacteria bacterium]
VQNFIDAAYVQGYVPQSYIGQTLFPRTTAESAAGVTPTNYAYAPGIVDRYGTNTTPGTTSMSAAIIAANAQAASGGPPVVFYNGTYLDSTGVTVSAPVVFESGAILKPGASITTTINAPITAGPVKIFDVSASSSLVTGKVVPVNADGRIYTEWFGAEGNGTTDDSVAFQATAALAAASGYIGIQLLAKTYVLTTTIYAGGSNSQSYEAPSWFGIEKRETTLSYSSIASGSGAFFFRGGSGRLCGARVEDIGFVGNSTSYGIVFSGQCGMRAVRCLFDTNSEGVRFWNNESGSFTEYCVADNCEFTINCATAAHYVVGSGSNSFNGSGFANRCLLNQNGGSALLIDSGAKVYNAPLDLQVWSQAANTAIVENNASISATFAGQITLEPSSTYNVSLGSGTGQYVLFSGPILSNNQSVVAGNFIQCRAAVLNTDGSSTPVFPRCSYQANVTTGANTLGSNFPEQHRMVYIRFQDTGYDYRYLLDVDSSGSGAAGYVETIASISSLNTAGYGAPTFTVSTSGELIATNSGWPASGVIAYYSENSFAPGVSGSTSQQF